VSATETKTWEVCEHCNGAGVTSMPAQRIDSGHATAEGMYAPSNLCWLCNGAGGLWAVVPQAAPSEQEAQP
jgi:hypothetical protein